MNKLKLIYSSSIASSLAIIFVTAITIIAELNAPVKDWLKSLSGHHWTSKGILSFSLYVIAILVIYGTTRKIDYRKLKDGLWVAIGTTILGFIILLVFFTGHHLGWY